MKKERKVKEKDIHKHDLRTTFHHRAIATYLCLIPCIVAICLCVPAYMENRIAWASGETIFGIIMAILALFAIGYLSPFFYYKAKTNQTIGTVINSLVPIKEKYAPPRTGKTSSMYLEAQILQPVLEFKLRYDYWFYSNMLPIWQKTNNELRLKKWEIIKETYEFFDSHDYAWCLMSSLPCKFKGKQVLRLTKRHLLQEVWAPRYCLWCIDEAGKLLPPQTFENKIVELVNTFRFIGHFGIFIIACEQRKDNLLIDFRSMTSITEMMLKQETKLKPRFLMWLFDKMKSKSIKPKFANRKRRAKFMNKFERYIKSIGFRVWTSSQTNLLGSQKHKYYWTNNLCLEYDSECMSNTFKADYLTADKNTVFDSLLISKEEAHNFMNSEKIKPKSVEEAEQRQNEIIAKLDKTLDVPISNNDIFKENIDIDVVIEEIKQSEFLQKSINSVKWINNNYERIVQGGFRNKKPVVKTIQGKKKESGNKTAEQVDNTLIAKLNAVLAEKIKETEPIEKEANAVMEKIIEEIKQSDFLKKAITTTAWINNNYKKIIQGKYRNRNKEKAV